MKIMKWVTLGVVLLNFVFALAWLYATKASFVWWVVYGTAIVIALGIWWFVKSPATARCAIKALFTGTRRAATATCGVGAPLLARLVAKAKTVGKILFWILLVIIFAFVFKVLYGGNASFGQWLVYYLALAWVFGGLRTIGTAEVALQSRFGSIKKKIYRSGLTWVPPFPGISLYRITTEPITFKFEGVESHSLRCKDRLLVFADIVGNIRFPYDEIDSLILMIKSKVPLDEAGLQNKVEEEVVSGMRGIVAKFSLEEALAKDNLEEIRKAAQTFLLRKTGYFAKAGICGNNGKNFTPGTGEVIVRIEQIRTTPGLEAALQKPAIAKLEAEAAKSTQERDAALIAGPFHVAMAEWVTAQLPADKSKSPEQVMAELVESGAYSAHATVVKDLMLANSGHLQVAKMEIGGPGGKSLPDSLQYLSLGGGGGAGLMLPGGRRQPRQVGGGKPNPSAERSAFFEKNYGIKPTPEDIADDDDSGY